MSKSNKIREDIEHRALSAILTDAFFTWPSAVTIAFSIIMFFLVPHLFPWWQPLYWLIFGAIAEGIYLVATITDPVAGQQAVSRMLEEQYNPQHVKNLSARQRLQKALEYKRNIDAFVKSQSGALQVSLSQTAADINNWIGLIYDLAKSIDAFEGNPIIDRDRRSVPTELATLKRRLTTEDDPGVKAELDEAIKIRQRLVDSLKTIENNVKRTDIKMDNTVAQLSTVYAQMQLINSRGELDGSRAQRLREEIRDEVDSLSDVVNAMNDVYQYKGYNSAVANLSADDSASTAGTQTTSNSAQTTTTRKS